MLFSVLMIPSSSSEVIMMVVLLCVIRLTPLGEPPSPRAAHVATAVGTMVVIQVSS